jgi:hypothetical protein
MKRKNYFYTSKVKHLNLKPWMLDEFDINKELEKMGAWLLGNCCDIKISNTMCTSASIV